MVDEIYLLVLVEFDRMENLLPAALSRRNIGWAETFELARTKANEFRMTAKFYKGWDGLTYPRVEVEKVGRA